MSSSDRGPRRNRISYPGDFDLSCNRVLRICVDGAYHAPLDATARGTTVEKRRRGVVDGQIPHWELQSSSKTAIIECSLMCTYSAQFDIRCIGGLNFAVEPLAGVTLKVFVRYARVAIFRTDDRVIARPESERHDITRKSVDAVGRE